MKKIILSCLLVLGFSAGLFATEGWYDDLEKAKEDALKTKRRIFAYFSGSDWCAPCMMFHKSVLNKKEFKEPMEKTFVLFNADYPEEGKQNAEIKKQNDLLAKKFSVESFPTVLILNQEGKLLATLPTYESETSPAAYWKIVEQLLKRLDDPTVK